MRLSRPGNEKGPSTSYCGCIGRAIAAATAAARLSSLKAERVAGYSYGRRACMLAYLRACVRALSSLPFMTQRYWEIYGNDRQAVSQSVTHFVGRGHSYLARGLT